MKDTATVNLAWARALIDGLASASVTRFVISPGSRSSPIVLACDQHPEVRTWILVDERSAGFFALGLARADGMPACLIATSGSAPAHWYPAVIEASESGIPLVLLSADRPPELHDCGSNQTVDQARLFGVHVRSFHDPGPPRPGPEATDQVHSLGRKAVSTSLWPHPGPVHVNLPFREPLVPTDAIPPYREMHRRPVAVSRPSLHPSPDDLERIRLTVSGRSGLIVTGPGSFDPDFSGTVTALANRLRCPIFADPLSGLRFGPHDKANVCCHYDGFLRVPGIGGMLQPQWILRFGAPPVSKPTRQFLQTARDADQLLVAPWGDWPDPAHRTDTPVRADPTLLCRALMKYGVEGADSGWLQLHQKMEKRAQALYPQAGENDKPFEADIISQLIDTLPDGSLLFSGNSLPVRQLDGWSNISDKSLRVLANRGASGIDGNLSTLLGLAEASDSPVVGLIGDLAFFHDLNGLLAAPGLDAVVIILNNTGGGIFGYLPQSGLDGFERNWLTPIDLEPADAARLFRTRFHSVRRQSQFLPSLKTALEESGVSLIEIAIDRKLSQARHQAYWEDLATHLDVTGLQGAK